MKKNIIFLVALALCTSAFALPGVDSYIEDYSGEYVYYADRSFERESYIGFLYYDEATYALRYYAPSDAKKKLPQKDITLYITIDPTVSYLLFTGEKITGASGDMEDTDIINYLHDLFYEFTARRQGVVLLSLEAETQTQDLLQFGGDVKVTYNALVPIFNLESIKSVDGTPLIQLQTVGLLESSEDLSFYSYKGLASLPKDKSRSFKKAKTATAQTVRFENQSITLDSMWTQSMENLWLLGDTALLTLGTISLPKEYANDVQVFTDTLLRKFCQGSEGSYALWTRQNISAKGAQTKVTNVFYQPESKSVTRDFKILTRTKDGFAFAALTVYESVYQKEKVYFDALLRTYSVQD